MALSSVSGVAIGNKRSYVDKSEQAVASESKEPKVNNARQAGQGNTPQVNTIDQWTDAELEARTADRRRTFLASFHVEHI